MNQKENQVIGIVGGMGPRAGLALFDSILCQSNAANDQEHFPVILMSLPGEIADRTEFIEGRTTANPAYAIAGIIRRLEGAGAQTIGIACNTAYAPEIYDVIATELTRLNSSVNLLHMPEETCRYLQEKHKGLRRVGVMVTNGTYRCNTFQRLLGNRGYEWVLPDWKFQQEVIHRMIYDPEFGLKATGGRTSPRITSFLSKALRFFEDRKAEAVIFGCTELSLLTDVGERTGIPIIDTTDVFARALIRECGRAEKAGAASLSTGNFQPETAEHG